MSVVVPVYGSARSLQPLHRRLQAALADEPAYEIVFVDDASPDQSRSVLHRLAADDPLVSVVELERNSGQHEAVLAGMKRARGEWVVVLDGDLQDPPEAIPALLARGRDGFDTVFAARRGSYQGAWRMLTSRIYRGMLTRLLPLPRGAGMFVALRREGVKALLDLRGPAPQVVAMIGAVGLHATSVPVAREPRSAGSSAYSTRARAQSALRGLRWTLWRRRQVGVERRRRHNDAQRRYFESQPKPNMLPRRSPYLERHVEQLVDFAELRAGEQLLEVGCGMGRYTLPLVERGLRVTGIDIAPLLLDRLRGAAAPGYGLELVVGDVVNPPAGLGGFDAVIGFFVLHHLHDLTACLRSIHGLLKPGGRVAFLEPNAYNPLYYVQIAATPSMTWEGDRGVVRMRRAVLFRALAEAGFDDLRLERFGFFPPFLANRARGAALERHLERIPPVEPLRPFQLLGGRRS